MWYKILCTAVPSIFIQNKKVYICYPELGASKKFQSCHKAVLKYFIFLNIFSSWQAVWPTSFSSVLKNTHPRQNVHSDVMAVSENTTLGGGILWNDLWKMPASITSHLPYLQDISPSLSKRLCAVLEVLCCCFPSSSIFFKIVDKFKKYEFNSASLGHWNSLFFQMTVIPATGKALPQQLFTARDILILKELLYE